MRAFIRSSCIAAFTLFSFTILIAQEFDGFAMYNDINSSTTYLINRNGDIAKSWNFQSACNYTVLLRENGNIVRGTINNGNAINGPAVGGKFQEFTPEGNLIWEFTHSSSSYVTHHDISLMPDGNVLMTAWELKTSDQLDSMGYTGNSNIRYPTHFIEISQIEGTTSGEIVWEWHMWDHMIQDVDPAKPNYGVVADNPQLMNINVPTSQGGGGPGGGGGDWFHVNGVDYNPVLDQIAFTSRYLSEVFIIDHSTTIEEAASHEGGNAGKGGDLLFRWGNPSNHGAIGNQNIFGPCHDARWLPNDGRPRAGYLMFFNNDGAPSVTGSSVDFIDLPFAADGYNYEWTPGSAYAPSEATFVHDCLASANGQSAANSMPNGNIFVNLSGGYQYEVDTMGNTVWQYNADPPKGFRYTCDYPGIQALINAGVISDTTCALVNAVDDIANQAVSIVPNPSTGQFNINGLPIGYQIESIQIFDTLGKQVTAFKQVHSFDLSNHPGGVYFANIQLNNGHFITKKVLLNH